MTLGRALFVLVGLGFCHFTRAAPEPTDVNECLVNNGGCNPGETCVNTPGSFTCAYMNGLSTLAGYVCFDINECLTHNGGCSEEATCENIPGSFICTCRVGYTGSGFTCTDIDECLVNNGGCSRDAVCTNTPGSFTCACKRGFTGDGFTCRDNDECSSNSGGCNALATCYNTHGSFTCTCNVGYYGNGFSCYDYNECLSNNGGCSRYATCTNTIGSSYCTCKPGYTGNGINCSVSDSSPSTKSTSPSSSSTTTPQFEQTSAAPVSDSVFTTESTLPSSTTAAPHSEQTSVVQAPRDCADIRALGFTKNGIYTVYVGNDFRRLVVYCDMTTTTGGWTVFQRRQDGSVDFYLDWAEYQTGFGEISGEFWIGNDNLYLLTFAKRYKLRVELTAFDGSTAYAEFDNFKVESAADKYRLSSIGQYSGNASDALSYHVGRQFSTKDQDNNCPVRSKGAWWYFNCYYSNLNGFYFTSPRTDWYAINWVNWKDQSMKRTEMKITPFA